MHTENTFLKTSKQEMCTENTLFEIESIFSANVRLLKKRKKQNDIYQFLNFPKFMSIDMKYIFKYLVRE